MDLTSKIENSKIAYKTCRILKDKTGMKLWEKKLRRYGYKGMLIFI